MYRTMDHLFILLFFLKWPCVTLLRMSVHPERMNVDREMRFKFYFLFYFLYVCVLKDDDGTSFAGMSFKCFVNTQKKNRKGRR